MSSRRSMPKSRHGCKTCKKRKVKCDYGQPVCANCKRLSRTCVWVDGLRWKPEHQRVGEPNYPQNDAVSSALVSGVVNLELMHHFTASTCFQTSDDTIEVGLWQDTIPRLAFQHPFLLHGILSLAALHLRHVRPDGRDGELLELAHNHQHEALTTYIPLLSNISATNCEPLFAFSKIIGTNSYALLNDPSATSRDIVDGIISTFDLLMGAKAIAIQGSQWLRQGLLASMLDRGHSLLDRNMQNIDDDLTRSLAALADRIEARSPLPRSPLSTNTTPGQTSLSPPTDFGSPEITTETYRVALRKLNILFPRSAEELPQVGTIIAWPVLIDEGYLTLLKRHDPASLVILGHYGKALHLLNHHWWLSGIGLRLVQAVDEVLPTEWSQYMYWARAGVTDATESMHLV